MPRRDGTGPMGVGSMTGRGLGLCAENNAKKNGTGFGIRQGLAYRCGLGRGFGRGYAFNQTSPKTQKEELQELKTILENRLTVIDNQLESL